MIEHTCIFLIVKCINFTKTENQKQDGSEKEVGVGCVCVFVLLVKHLDNKKPFRPLYILKHVLKNNFVLII